MPPRRHETRAGAYRSGISRGSDDRSEDELGAHVSTRGGLERAPGRARLLDSVCLQLFTKQPTRWADPALEEPTLVRFREELDSNGILLAGSHDSYLINLASPDPRLFERSVGAFRRELARCRELRLDWVVTHPGNATDGDRNSGLERNADALIQVLGEAPSPPKVLLELTAGAGHALGCSFRELAAIIQRIPPESRDRLGVCFDTCHAFAAGYDLVNDYQGVFEEFGDVLGLERLGLFHLNDSKGALGSRRDRHENIGAGALGPEPFRKIMTDPRFLDVPKIIETPKGEDPVAADLENLRRLRSFRPG